MAKKTRKDIIDIAQQFCREHGLEAHPLRKIYAGDQYIGCRNTGPELLICKSVNPDGWIIPLNGGYSYDLWECVKVTSRNEVITVFESDTISCC